MKRINPWKPYLVRSHYGYTIQILKRIPGAADQRGGLELLDLSWTKAEKVRETLKRVLRDECVPVFDADLHRATVDNCQKSIQAKEAEILSLRETLAKSEALLRLCPKPKGRKS